MNYYRVTLIVRNKQEIDPETLYDDFYDKNVGKNKVVLVESSEIADDLDESLIEDEDEDD